jgi:glutaredoxin
MLNWLINWFSPKRKCQKKKPTGRSLRKSPKRRSLRKSPKRRSLRKSPKRRSPRKSPKRRSLRKSPKRRSRRRNRSTGHYRKVKSRKRRNSLKFNQYQKDLRKKIKSSGWFIVTMSGCDYCTTSKKILRTHKQKLRTVRLTDNNSSKIWSVTDKLTKKYRYFPMIFRNGKFFGGYVKLKSKFSK